MKEIRDRKNKKKEGKKERKREMKRTTPLTGRRPW